MDNMLKQTLIGWAEEYNDPKYFSTSYKKHTGLSPMQQKHEK